MFIQYYSGKYALSVYMYMDKLLCSHFKLTLKKTVGPLNCLVTPPCPTPPPNSFFSLYVKKWWTYMCEELVLQLLQGN
jgi:hypothetical protein